MMGERFISRLDNLLKSNRMLGLALITMVFWNVANTWVAAHQRNATQTVIVPIGGAAGMMIGNGGGNEQYIREMSRLITALVGTYSAGTVRAQLQELLLLFHPTQVGAAQLEFQKLWEQVERYPSISSIARWSGGKDGLKYTKDTIQVRATKDRLVNGSVAESHPVYYCIKYTVDGARFWVMAVLEKEGTGNDLCYVENSTRVAAAR